MTPYTNSPRRRRVQRWEKNVYLQVKLPSQKRRTCSIQEEKTHANLASGSIDENIPPLSRRRKLRGSFERAWQSKRRISWVKHLWSGILCTRFRCCVYIFLTECVGHPKNVTTFTVEQYKPQGRSCN